MVRGAWSKYRATCARIAIVLAMLKAACVEVSYLDKPRDADDEDVAHAVVLTEYFKRTFKKVLASTTHGQVKLSDDQRAVLECALMCEDMNTFTFNYINSSLGRFRGDKDRLTEALDVLIKLDCIRAAPMLPPTGKPGRPPSPSYLINPNVRSFYSFNSLNPGDPTDEHQATGRGGDQHHEHRPEP